MPPAEAVGQATGLPVAPAGGPPRAAVAAGLFLTLAVGLWPYLNPERIPGDLGDNRFNMVVLEHGYAWLTGKASSFWSAPFFYPAPKVIASSDAHLGTLPAFAALRLTGLSREDAFQAWMVLACLLNFSACYLVLRRLGGGAAGSLAGAFLFAFGLPSAHQATHAQLLPRFLVPLAFGALIDCWRAPRPGALALCLAALVGQIYCGIYLGFFLALCLGLLLLILLLRSGDVPGLFKTLVARPGNVLWLVVLVALAGAALLPLALPYAEAGAALGMWPPGEIAAMTPRPASWLSAPQSPLWSWLGRLGPDLPVPQEHALFVGLVPLAALAALPVLARRAPGQADRTALAMLWLALVAAVLTLHVFGGSLYGLIAPHVPGMGAIRSVARIVLVLLFPLAVVLCRVVDRLAARARTPWASSLALFASLALLAADQAAPLPSFSKAQALARVAAVKAAVGPVAPDRVLFHAPDAPGQGQAFAVHLDAMLAAQDLGMATVNGFSGHTPLGYPAALDTLSGEVCPALRRWLCRNGGLGLYAPLVQTTPRCQAPADPVPEAAGAQQEGGDHRADLAVEGEGRGAHHDRQQDQGPGQGRVQALVGPAAARQVAGHQARAEHQQDRRDGGLREAGQLGEDRLDIGEDREHPAKAQHGHGQAQLHLRTGQHGELLAQRGGLGRLPGAGNQHGQDHEGQGADGGHGPEGHPPAEGQAQPRAERHAQQGGEGQAGEHDRDRRGLALGRHQGDGDQRADAERTCRAPGRSRAARPSGCRRSGRWRPVCCPG